MASLDDDLPSSCLSDPLPAHVRSKAIYIWGAHETFKTSFVSFMLRKLNKTVHYAESSGNFSFQSYNQEKVIFMNDFDISSVSEPVMLNLLENSVMKLATKGGYPVLKMLPTYNIITSNTSPDIAGWGPAMRSRIFCVGTDFGFVKVEPEISQKWNDWLNNGGVHASDLLAEAIVISDDESEHESDDMQFIDAADAAAQTIDLTSADFDDPAPAHRRHHSNVAPRATPAILRNLARSFHFENRARGRAQVVNFRRGMDPMDSIL